MQFLLQRKKLLIKLGRLKCKKANFKQTLVAVNATPESPCMPNKLHKNSFGAAFLVTDLQFV